MRIHLESLEIEAIIGLLDFERLTKQRVVVDVELEYDYTQKDFIDYADLAQLIELQVKREQYELLEEALLSLKKSIAGRYPQLKRLQIKISKPDILSNTSVALSNIWIFH